MHELATQFAKYCEMTFAKCFLQMLLNCFAISFRI